MKYTNSDIDWFESYRNKPEFNFFLQRPVAYFCAEYALSPNMPIYAGGLGILAGDVVREAEDQKFPLVAIGMYYHEGYSCESNKKINANKRINPASIGLEPVVDQGGERVFVKIPILDRIVTVQAWFLKKGSVRVFLLDTDISANEATDRKITDRLYVGDKEIRLKQEIVLGIGGQRLLEALGIHPSVYHLNEGHSAFLVFELIRHQMKERKLSFDEAKQFARRRIVFINHTLVPAGNEIYSNDLVSIMLAKYAEDLQVSVVELLKLGLVQDSSTFSMTMLSLRMAGIVSAVSDIHARKAKEIWTSHPMVGVTNGIHVPTWDMVKIDKIQKGEFWKIHQGKKRELLSYIEKETGVVWDENELLIGWARRFVLYKQPLAIIEDIKKFLEIANADNRRVRVVFAGFPHSNDTVGLEKLQKLKTLIKNELAGSVVYLENYDMNLAKIMLSGTDVWLNTPSVGFEACGTSGMKAALNGSLPFSTKDGWVDEVNLSKIGWIIENVAITDSILELIKNTIVPMYYERSLDGTPTQWEEYMYNARNLILEKFNATRMLREYVETLYT